MRSCAAVVNLKDRGEVVGPQKQALTALINGETVGAAAISGGAVRMPPHGMSKAHMHATSEIIVAVLAGDAVTVVWEDDVPRLLYHSVGSMCYVPAGVPHVAVNLSGGAEVIAYEFRTDPAFNEDVVLLESLDPAVPDLAALARRRWASLSPSVVGCGYPEPVAG